MRDQAKFKAWQAWSVTPQGQAWAKCKSKLIHKQGEYQGKKSKGLPGGLVRLERAEKSELLLRTKYLKRDLGKDLPVNSRVIIHKIVHSTQEKPYVHLTLKYF